MCLPYKSSMYLLLFCTSMVQFLFKRHRGRVNFYFPLANLYQLANNQQYPSLSIKLPLCMLYCIFYIERPTQKQTFTISQPILGIYLLVGPWFLHQLTYMYVIFSSVGISIVNNTRLRRTITNQYCLFPYKYFTNNRD